MICVAIASLALWIACSGAGGFEGQIIKDVTSKMGTGICDSIPAGSVIKNVQVGEIVPIGETGLIDVTIEFDFENSGQTRHYEGALLYSKAGSRYFLEALGGCDYERER